MSTTISERELLRLAAEIVAAHVAHTRVPAEELPDVIRSVYAALSNAGELAVVAARPEPAVPVTKSIFPDYLVCLEDGKQLKMLKRHLQTSYGMSPADYRARWDLPATYPMVAPNYTARRSSIAKEAGLGRKPAPPAPPPRHEVPVQRIPEGKRGKKPGAPKNMREQPAALPGL